MQPNSLILVAQWQDRCAMMRAAQLLEQVAAHFELYGDAVLHRHAAALTALSLAHGLLFERIGHTCIAN
jgi:hypothetical protein